MSRNEHFADGAGYRIEHEENGSHPTSGVARAYQGGQHVGSLTYHVNESYFDRKAIYPDNTHVEPSHRRQGVARALYADVTARHGLPVIHDPEAMTPDAKEMTRKLQTQQPGKHLWWDADKNKSVVRPRKAFFLEGD